MLLLDLRGTGEGLGHDAVVLAAEAEGKEIVEEGGGMVVGEGVVKRHVLEKGLDVRYEELSDLRERKGGVNEEGAEVGFEDVGEALGKG